MIIRPALISTLLLAVLIFVCTTSPTKRSSDVEQIVKSASDDNEYRAVTLSNEIRCVLVSDTSTEIAAVQLQVDAGSVHEDTPGLAHLVEHMIFFGSVKYPDGKLYTDYLEENGGGYNGFTGSTYTGYVFQVNNKSWAKAGEMLASLIGEPIFSRNMFESAIEAVDSEYRIRLRSDLRSLSTLSLELSNPEARDSGFTVGSRETLNVTDIYDQVVKFHDRYYSANLISLVIVANDTLDSLEALAEETFGNIPNNNRQLPIYTSLPFPTKDKRYLGKKIYYKIKGTGHEITIGFPVNIPGYPSLSYIKYLLQHKGRGSIYQFLLTRGYITTSWSAKTTLDDSQKVILALICGATEKGVADPEFILTGVFRYLRAACSDGVNVELWNSVNEINMLTFRFQEKKRPNNIAYSIIGNMQATNDSRKYLGAPSQEKLDVTVENEILGFFDPDNFNLYVGSDSFSDSEATSHGPRLTKSEYYYNTPYLDTSFSEEQLEAWRDVETDPELYLPKPNTLIPKNLKIFRIDDDAGKLPLEIVTRNEDDHGNIWWFQDQEWQKPKVWVKCKIYPSTVTIDARAKAVLQMLDQMFDQIKDLAFYDVKEVKMNPVITFAKDWTVSISGYSDPKKVEAVIIKMMDALSSLSFEMDEARFNSTVLIPIQRIFDVSTNTGPQTAYRHLTSIIYEQPIDPSAVKDIAATITQSDIKEYMRSFLEDISVTCTAMGNLRKHHAIKYSQMIKEKLMEMGSIIRNEDRRTLTKDLGLYKLPPGPPHVIRSQMEDTEAEPSTILIGFQIGKSESTGSDSDKPPYTLSALTDLLSLIMGPACFNYLRTEKQLGYAANCFAYEDLGTVLHFYFYIQGSRDKAGPDVMNREIHSLIDQQRVLFHHLAGTDEGLIKFEGAKLALKQRISVRAKHTSLYSRAGDFNAQIFSSTTDFSKVEKRLAAVEAITVGEFVEFYEQYIVGVGRRTITSQVYGASHLMPAELEEGEILIEDIKEFRKQLTDLF